MTENQKITAVFVGLVVLGIALTGCSVWCDAERSEFSHWTIRKTDRGHEYEVAQYRERDTGPMRASTLWAIQVMCIFGASACGVGVVVFFFITLDRKGAFS